MSAAMWVLGPWLSINVFAALWLGPNWAAAFTRAPDVEESQQ